MPDSLITDWKCIATSGHTIDGRYIKKEWLEEMAETYDPDTYLARLWVDHMRYSSYGSVAELKVEKAGDKVKLYAKIAPSRALLQLNQVWNEKNTFSIEPQEDFAKTGKFYLVGLGITDDPASLGTDEMHFSKLKNERRDFTARYAGEEVPDLRMAEEDHVSEKTLLKFFSRLFKQQHPEENDMSMEEINALTETVKELSAKIDKFTNDNGGEETPTEPEESGGAAGDAFSSLADSLKEVAAAQKELSSKFAAISDKLDSSKVLGTKFTENTGTDDKKYL